MISFSLTPHIYAAAYDDAIIILDSDQDNYLSLIEEAAEYLTIILEHQFTNQNSEWFSAALPDHTEELTYWITYYLDAGYITETRGAKKTIAPKPIKTGGLHDYQWDTKSTWSPFKQARTGDIIKAFIQLSKVHRMLKRTGLKELLRTIEQCTQGATYQPSTTEIEQLSAAIDAASLLYPKKTLCLAWAATFALMAGKKNWHCNFVIGVQTNPFYAHAWAESADGCVINDNPIIKETLSLILKQPGKGI